MLNKIAFQEILNQAKEIGISDDKNRNILREYLQCRFLGIFYGLRGSHNLIFVGGTSLRLLRNLDRFSEDLDFDNIGLTKKQIKNMVAKTIKQLEKEGFMIESSFKNPKAVGSFKIKFLGIFPEVGIDNNPKEKLMIKLDFARPKKILKTEVLVLSSFGVIQRIPSYPRETILAYKFRAIKQRERIIVRDFYDVAWLLAWGVKPNLEILKIKTEKEFYKQLIISFKKLKPTLKSQKKNLQQFLIKEEKISLIDSFEDLIESKIKKINT